MATGAPNAKRFRNCIGPRLRKLRMSRKQTQEQLAAQLQLAGLHTWDRVAVAKVESRIRSVYDYEMAVLSKVLAVDAAKLLPSLSDFSDELEDLMRGERTSDS